MIEVNNISKSFGTTQALDDLSFVAKDGEITGILGPNGAGKTTCLRTLYGLIKADSGVASIDGVDSAKHPIDVRGRLGIFPDKFGSHERLTVREQIDYFASLQNLSGKTKREAIENVIDSLDMHQLAPRKSVGFSQGQRMKVALAQALVHKPQNIVLDEPTRGLDVMSTRLLRNYLARLREDGHCILFSSHVMQEVAALCDRVIIIADGKLAAQGTPAQLCEIAKEVNLEDAFVKLIGTDEGVAA